MKYMGSKRLMLQNGFGSAIAAAASNTERIVDLFAGSAAVSWYAAERFDQPVLAVDLQRYSAVLARAVVARTYPLNLDKIDEEWLDATLRSAEADPRWSASCRFDQPKGKTRVEDARRFCARNSGGPIWSAYGGHYFSPRQALLIDRGHMELPQREPYHSACHAALIAAAAYCAAAPGHTAQPFQPTQSALPYIRENWGRDPLSYARSWLESVAPRVARAKGAAKVGDAAKVVAELRPTDLVIVDPPYSAVQYSRFYHVLEAIARCDDDVLQQGVSGVGRYPAREHRPQSDFSLKSFSRYAIEDLLGGLANAGCTALITFPNKRCSNGLSGTQITNLARTHFKVTTKTVRGRFSTLGGNNTTRAARQSSAELIIALIPN